MHRYIFMTTPPEYWRLEYWSVGVLEPSLPIIPSFQYSITPFFAHGTSITKFINGSTVTLWSGGTKRRGKRQLDDRRTFHHRADAEVLVIIDRRVDELPVGPGEKYLCVCL